MRLSEMIALINENIQNILPFKSITPHFFTTGIATSDGSKFYLS
jgi:hypothetical protein